jgi:hypothetical protein
MSEPFTQVPARIIGQDRLPPRQGMGGRPGPPCRSLLILAGLARPRHRDKSRQKQNAVARPITGRGPPSKMPLMQRR